MLYKTIENLEDFFIEQGRGIYDANKQEQIMLPAIQKLVSNQQLKKMIDKQMKIRKNQSIRLLQTFRNLNINLQGEKNECYNFMFKHVLKIIERSKYSDVRDVIIINSIQQLIHSKIACLGSLTSYASEMDYDKIAESLFDTLNEEKTIDQELTNLAEDKINKSTLFLY